MRGKRETFFPRVTEVFHFRKGTEYMFELMTILSAAFDLHVSQPYPRCNFFRLFNQSGEFFLRAFRETGDALTHKERLIGSPTPILCLRSEEFWNGEIETGALMDSNAISARGGLPFGDHLQPIEEIFEYLISAYLH